MYVHNYRIVKNVYFNMIQKMIFVLYVKRDIILVFYLVNVINVI